MKIIQKGFVCSQNLQFASCHASTIIANNNGSAMAAWFAGTDEGRGDTAIWGARFENNAWSTPVKLADQDDMPHWNPVLFQPSIEQCDLYYKVGWSIPEWHTRITTSYDKGLSWTSPRELVPGDVGGRGPVKNKPIRLENSQIAAPLSIEKPDPLSPGNQLWEAYVDLSTNGGDTWIRSDKIPLNYNDLRGQRQFGAKGIIQPTLWERAGSLHALMRSTEGSIFRSVSHDHGHTWEPAYPTRLAHNNSGIDLVDVNHQILVLVCNPVTGMTSDPPRTPLVMEVSFDNGVTWRSGPVLEGGPGEYSYPAVIVNKDEIWVTYTWNRERIAFYRVSILEEIMACRHVTMSPR